MKRRATFPLILLGASLVVGCGGNNMGADASAASQQPDYGATKQMVLDILHSQDGKTALEDVMKDPTFKQQLSVSQTDITKAVTASIESKKTQSFLSEQAKDPQFATALAKAVQPELMQTIKQLMKDPEYQKQMLVLMKSPDFTKSLQDYMQGPQFRTDVQKIMVESMDTPSFKMKFETALKKAVEDAMKQQQGSSKGEGKEGDSSSGDGGDQKSES